MHICQLVVVIASAGPQPNERSQTELYNSSGCKNETYFVTGCHMRDITSFDIVVDSLQREKVGFGSLTVF